MPTVFQLRRGTTTQNNNFTGAAGELSVDTDLDTVRVHDGTTAGGFALVMESATQTLTNKTITSPTITGVSPTVTLTGAVTGSGTMTDLGNVSIATTATSDPTITLTGDVTGSGTMTNLGNVSFATTIAANSVALGTDTTGNYVGTVTAGTGIATSGASSGEGVAHSISLSHLGIQSLTDPDADRILFWDDSAGATAWLTVGTNLTLSGTTLSADAQSPVAGTAIDVSGTTISVDLSELSTSTTDGDGDYFVVVDTLNAQRKLTKGSINISGFNNDSGYSTTTGTVTSVAAGSYLTGGTITTTGTLAVDATSANTASKVVARDASGNFSAGVVTATATAARYADLAEKYISDVQYPPGTVVVLGGDAEVTRSDGPASRAIAGIVSTDPAYLMNNELEADIVVDVALIGRVPCMVTGIISKGDLLVSSSRPGHACAWTNATNPPAGSIVGKAIENKTDEDPGVIEVLVGRL